MKKIILILSLVLLGNVASAQALNIQNAIEQQNRGYLKKAKEYIDQACTHEQTADSPKAWYWRSMIYYKIGDEIQKKTKKGNELKALVPNWVAVCKESALACRQFDTKGEYTESVNQIILGIGTEYNNMAINAYNNDHDFARAIALCDTAILLHSISGNDNLKSDNYLAGMAAQQLGDNELVKKYFGPLVRTGKCDKATVYQVMYRIYVSEHDTVNAVRTASNFAKAFPDNYEADMLEAQACLLRGNLEKAQESMNKALGKVKDDAEKAGLLGTIGAVYEVSGDFAKAEESYNESLKLQPNQFMANNNMGIMFYNRAVDKLNAASEVDLDDETGLADQLQEDAKGLFRQCIQYYVNAIAYIDGLPEAEASRLVGSLHNCLNALKTAYLRLEMNDEFMAVNARIQKIESGNK